MKRFINYITLLGLLVGVYSCKDDVAYVEADWARPIFPIDGASVKIDYFKPNDTLNFTWEARSNATYKIMFDTDMHFENAVEMDMGHLDSLKIRNEDFLAVLKELRPQFNSIGRYFWKVEQSHNGNVQSSWRYFDAVLTVESFTDARDNEVYNANQYVLQDGSLMTIMRENLRAKVYADNTAFPFAAKWAGTSSEVYNKLAGAYYTWATATRLSWDDAKQASLAGEEVQGVCPDGWHLPSMSELEQLRLYLGQYTAGLTVKDPMYWKNTVNITNSSKMNIVPSGYFWHEGVPTIDAGIDAANPVAYFWTLTPYLKGINYAWGEVAMDDNKSKATLMSLYNDVDDIYFQGYSVVPGVENRGCPVRCIMNRK